jgi:hypothetical protein
MVWVAAFAAWSAAVGLVVGAAAGDGGSSTTPSGVSALLYVVLPAVPTAVALWFNDWARDGFPSAQDRRRGDYRRADPALRDLPGRSGAPQRDVASQAHSSGQQTVAHESISAPSAGQPPRDAR